MLLCQKPVFFIILIIVNLSVFAQKELIAKRVTSSIKIDGDINDAAWRNAPQAQDFIELRPNTFKKEDFNNKTEVYFLYDDNGIYIGGYCHEKTIDSIATELIGRDGFGNNDFIGFIFDTYKDKINGFEYFLTPLGEQMDAKITSNGEDFAWNAVWRSKTKINKDGWSFEIFIPFSAIRFSTKKTQEWGLNITRSRQKSAQQLFWNKIDPKINGFLTQAGVWKGLENIKPSLRLQFSPYISAYANHYPYNQPNIKNFSATVNGGMDVKYGISQAITLDMTLIPDFGQVQSDNQVLNLTPFEVKFNEYRSFFTEGTELFNKGNFFYSRRIGEMPLHYFSVYDSVKANETIIKNPSDTKLINATKISGRMQSGLGIGFFNALTSPQYATIEDDEKKQRKIETSPLSNYNILVLDQTLKHNSSISFINTNVWRSGTDYDANVSAALFDINSKNNMWNIGGKIANSNLVGYLPQNKTQSGYSHTIYLGKTSGRFNFNIQQELVTSKFNSNDLGYFTFNNYIDHNLSMGYKWIVPGHWYNRIFLNFNTSYSRRLNPGDFQNASINTSLNTQLKNLWWIGGSIGFEPKSQDFYEARVQGRMFRRPGSAFVNGWFNTNDAKKYFISLNMFFSQRTVSKSRRYDVNFSHRYRFNNKLSIGHELNTQFQPNNVGYATLQNDDIIFGSRNMVTIENILNFKYNFSTKMGLSTRIRHYWSQVAYNEYYTLQQTGDLQKNAQFNSNVNQNYNAFNIDATFSWQFAPGSFINLVWKDAAYNFSKESGYSYFANLYNTLNGSQNNSLSFKILYFLDYLVIKKKKLS